MVTVETAPEMLARLGTDADKWARECMLRLNQILPSDHLDCLRAWFANAIEQAKMSTGRERTIAKENINAVFGKFGSQRVGARHPHYHKDVKHLEYIDVYRVLQLFTVNDPCLQHAIKKLLVAGGRGAGKDTERDIKEAIDSLTRWQEMRVEDLAQAGVTLSQMEPVEAV